MTMTIKAAVKKILQEDPTLSNGQVAALAGEMVGRQVAPSTVAVNKHNLKHEGAIQDTGRSSERRAAAVSANPPKPLPVETPEQRCRRIRKRFIMQDRLVERVVGGRCKSLIVSGPPGVGKSFGVERDLKKVDDEKLRVIRGAISVPGLIINAWATREEGGILVLDDCDDLFRDETGLNILKTMLDTSDKRIITYAKRAHWMEEEGIDQTFQYRGSVIFLTNVDFEMEIAKGARLSPHYSALIDRSLFLSLTMRSTEDFLTRLRHLSDVMIPTLEAREECMEFVSKHAARFHTLSARLIKHIYEAMVSDPDDWRHEIEVTKMRSL